MHAHLQVLHAKANLQQINLRKDVLIGRGTDCNLRIASNEVSRRHCQLLVGEGEVGVIDLGSANGTLVNGERIPPRERVALAPGATLEIGPARFAVQFDPHDRPTATAPSATAVFDPLAETVCDGVETAAPFVPQEAVAEPSPSPPTEAQSQPKPGKLRSLFGRLGRKTPSATSPVEADDEPVAGESPVATEPTVEPPEIQEPTDESPFVVPDLAESAAADQNAEADDDPLRDFLQQL